LNEDYGSTGSYGDYWSSTQHPLYSNAAYRYLGFYSEDYYWDYRDRFYGFTVRPVVEDFVLSPIILSSSTLNLIVGKEETISITSGSGYYIIKNNDETIATATIQGNSITVTAVKAGTTTITVTDTRNGQTATIEVTVTDSFLSCPDNHHPHIIDLGLPSGTKWACCNVGASSPEAYGGYYAWGEMEGKDVYNEVSYLYSTGEDTNDDGWYDDESDYTNIGSSICGTGYDVAHVKWGEGWSMPSIEQIEELVNSVSCLWITLNGTDGYLFTGPNGNSVFLPACGSRYADQTAGSNSYGDYWSGTLYPSIEGNNRYAYYMDFYKGTVNHNNYWGRTFGHSIRPVYDSSFFFSLSDDTVNVFVNSTTTVSIESGSGEYEIQNEQTDIIDVELILADRVTNPDAKDEIFIYGKAEGTAIVTFLDKEKNKTAILVVNVKTPTAEDIAETEDYISRVSNYIDQLGEIPVETFQTDLLSWLENQEWVKDVKSSAESITINIKNGANVVIDFIDSYFNYKVADVDTEDYYSKELPAYTSIAVPSTDDEDIIDSSKVIYIQGRTMPSFEDRAESMANRENELINKAKQVSPVNFKIDNYFKDLSFLEKGLQDYDMILLGQTHGGFAGGGERAGFFQVEVNKCYPNNSNIALAIDGGTIKQLKNEPDVYNVYPKIMEKTKIKDSAIFYSNYCYSYYMRKANTNCTFFGYGTRLWYPKGSYHLTEFFFRMSLGFTYHEAIAPMMKPYDKRFGEDKVYTHVVPLTSRSDSKQRYFSISTDDVTEYSQNGPVVTGAINGYKNLKSGISYYVYAFPQGEELVPEDITKGQRITKIEEDGTFSQAYSALLFTEYPEEYQVVVGFEYGGIIYYGPIKTLRTKGLCPDGSHHHMIDLGLPSGTKWACCNVGASSPEGYGGYYAWGETKEKSKYSFDAYQHRYLDKEGHWCNKHIGTDIAGTSYDVAHVKWSGSWVMPSRAQIQELLDNCTKKWTTVNGVNGYLFIGKNGNSVFLPAAGYRWSSEFSSAGNSGCYWSSTLYEGSYTYECYAYTLYLYDSRSLFSYHQARDMGLSVRPVR